MASIQDGLSKTNATKEKDLRVEVLVVPPDESSCPLKQTAESDARVEEMRRKESGERCVSDLVVVEDGDREVVNSVSDVDEDCFCPVFESSDILPHIEGVRDGGVVVSTYVSDRKEMKGVLEGLRSKAEDVTLLSVGEVGDGGSVDVDTPSLSEKQRETVEKAVVRGYYDDPPGVTLGELADEFGVSKSAVSQRLNRAEAKIVEGFLD